MKMVMNCCAGVRAGRIGAIEGLMAMGQGVGT